MRLTRQPASIALAALLITAAVSAVERSAKWWSDNLAGPDSSNYVDLDQIKKSNVDDLEVAWTYPVCGRRIQPDCRRRCRVRPGRNGSLIALDASTGKEIWIHEGLTG